MNAGINPARLEAAKWLAVLAMFCDHIGLALLPDQHWLRQIGTFAFPVFFLCYGVGLGWASDPLRIARRLLAPGFAAQLAWQVIDPGHPFNVLFVCAFAALVVAAWRHLSPHPARWLLCLAPLVLLFVRAEGGALGLGLIAGGLLAAYGSFWLFGLASGLWLAFLPSAGFAAGVMTVVVQSRVPVELPRVRGLLSWVYAGHLLLIASIVGYRDLVAPVTGGLS